MSVIEFRAIMRHHEKEIIFKTLKLCKWDKPVTAKMLGIGLSSLYRKIKELNIERTKQ